jgi:hypothetical protein
LPTQPPAAQFDCHPEQASFAQRRIWAERGELSRFLRQDKRAYGSHPLPHCPNTGILPATCWPLSVGYNAFAMIDTFLVAEKTGVNAKGDGAAIDVSSAGNRVFLLNLHITEIVEQESLDVSIQGSDDGGTWNPKPLTNFPQKFYRGQHPLLLDLSAQPNIKFVRAHWEVARWGRGSEIPMFEFSVSMKEVPTEILKEATAEAKALV